MYVSAASFGSCAANGCRTKELRVLAKGNDAWTQYDLRTPEATIDPYPTYARIRSEAPVHWNKGMGGWVVARYDDVTSFFRDPRLSANRFTPLAKLLTEEKRLQMEPILTTAARWSIILDPPEHTRLRGLTQKGFSPRVLGAMRPRIQELTDSLLDRVQSKKQFDLMAEFAAPLPATVIANLLGARAEDFPRFRVWSD